MFSAFGVDRESYVARFNEGLRLMRALWTEPTVNFEGRFWQLNGAAMEPKPFQKPGPPVWFGGSHPAALGRAVRHGDGFFGAGSNSTEQFAKQVQIVRAELADQGRDPATFPIAKRVYIAVDDDAERARERMRAALDRLYGFFRPRRHDAGLGVGNAGRLRTGSAGRRRRGRGADPAQPAVRRPGADGTPGSGGSAAAIVMRSRGTHTGDAWLNASCFRTPRGAS